MERKPPLFNKTYLKAAGSAYLALVLTTVACAFLSAISAADDSVLFWIMFIGLLLAYVLSAMVCGNMSANTSLKASDRLLMQSEHTGKPIDEADIPLMFSLRKGVFIAALIAIPGLALAVAALLTQDSLQWLTVTCRLYFVAALKAFSLDLAVPARIGIYFGVALAYPLFFLFGYRKAKLDYDRMKIFMEKLKEDDRNGVPRKRRVGAAAKKKKRDPMCW